MIRKRYKKYSTKSTFFIGFIYICPANGKDLPKLFFRKSNLYMIKAHTQLTFSYQVNRKNCCCPAGA